MEVIRLGAENFDTAVAKAAAVLGKGGIVVYPTDTLYGLAVDAANRNALERLRFLKGRERKKPISIVVPAASHIGLHADIRPEAAAFIEAHLPGALTLVLPGKEHLSGELLLNGQVGIRVPDEPFALALAAALGRPITATSANLSGTQTPATADELIRHFGPGVEHLDLIVDAGPRAGGLASTVITFIDGAPHIIREGAISRDSLGI